MTAMAVPALVGLLRVSPAVCVSHTGSCPQQTQSNHAAHLRAHSNLSHHSEPPPNTQTQAAMLYFSSLSTAGRLPCFYVREVCVFTVHGKNTSMSRCWLWNPPLPLHLTSISLFLLFPPSPSVIILPLGMRSFTLSDCIDLQHQLFFPRLCSTCM